MEYIHVRSLEKYNPSYKDRNLIWGKIYIRMVHGDPDCEIIDEINWGRLIKIILLELEAKRPLPLDEGYFSKKGFNFKNCSMSNTLKVLHNFLEVVTGFSEERYVDKNRIDKIRIDNIYKQPPLNTVFKEPTKEDVEKYCEERQNGVDAQKFVDFYTAKGWMIGKNKIKDWKACVRTWEKNEKKEVLYEHPL